MEEAFEKLEKNTYDAIISDYEMPCKDGLEFLKELRDQKNGVPFILFTGKGREDVAIHALNLGADYYVDKHGSPETVYGELSHYLRSAVERNRIKLQNNTGAMAIQNIQEAIVMSDAVFTITSWNKAAERSFGLHAEEVIGKKVHSVFKNILVDPKLEQLLDTTKGQGQFKGEVVFLNKNGQRRVAALDAVSVFAEDGKFKGAIAAAHDITESKRSEKLLAESESKYRMLVESSLQGLLITEANPFRLTFANKAMAKMLGYSIEELMALPPEKIEQLVYSEDRGVFFDRLRGRFIGEKAETSLEFRAVRKDGSTVWLEALSNRVEYLGKLAVQGIFLDISERKKAQEVLKASEERYRDLANSLPDIVFEADLNGKVTFLNEKGFEKVGLSHEDFEKGLNIFQFIVPEDRERAEENAKNTLSGKMNGAAEYRMTKKDGTGFTALIRASPRVLENKVIGLRALVIDITERKETEERLIESEQKYRDIFENARDAIFVHDLKGKVISVNKLVEEYGFTKEQIVGHNIMNFIPKKYWPKLVVDLSKLARGKRVEAEIEVNTPTGRISAEYRSNPIVRGNRVVAVHGILRDTTDRRRSEQAMVESQQKFSSLFAANPEAVVFLDTDFHVVEANPRFTALFGFSSDEVKGKAITDLIVPDGAIEESEILRQQNRSGSVVVERRRRDGLKVPLFLSGGPVVSNDRVIGAIMVYKDLSDIITVQEALGKALDRAELLNEKLSIVGGFVRHDVRNKLFAINGNIYLMKKQAGTSDPMQMYLDQIKQSSENIVRILDFAKNFESLGNEKLAVTDVGAAVDQAASLFTDLKGVRIINECRGFNVLADSMLTTIFHNLIDNSMKYAGKLSQIKVSGFENPDGSRRIIYEDDGAGIDAKTKKHLFEKGVGKGTGLGLYLIKKATDIYGWKICEAGGEGQGAKFVMTIPKPSKNGKINYESDP